MAITSALKAGFALSLVLAVGASAAARGAGHPRGARPTPGNERAARYHRFLGLTYPDLPTADRALVDGRIDESQWQAIRRASRAGRVPSQ